MLDVSLISINSSASALEALKVIDCGLAQIALVVDDQQKLIGTVTDGDI